MKISKLFHWLYASVMFLPLVIIPLFGIWTINHDHNEPITINVAQNQLVDFNQLSDDTSTLKVASCSVTRQTGSYVITSGTNATGGNVYVYDSSSFYQIKNSHVYVVDLYVNNSTGSFALRNFNTTYPVYNFNANEFYHLVTYGTCLGGTGTIFPFGLNSVTTGMTCVIDNFQLFDLTQMFGVGNEPTLSEFRIMFPNQYYDYTSSEILYVKNTSSITYSDTDVGSQFLYTLYNSTEKYLNFDSVLNLGAISDWINENVFNGNAPLVFYIVWHYLDYWLILSIFWLCFDVLIYVPNIAHRWLDKASLE